MIPNLKKLRERHNISQEYMAKALGISRPTYIQIEKGEKEPMVSQLKKLMDLFGTDFSIMDPKTTMQKTGTFMPEPNLKKFKEVLLYILEKVGAKPNIGETALFKLLYFMDFNFYEKHGKPLIGLTYIKNHHGPTPKQFKKVADEMILAGELEQVRSKFFQYDQRKYLPHRAPDLSIFSAPQIKHIDDVLVRLSDKNASELSHYSHEDAPWQITAPQNDIDYNLVFQRLAPYAQQDYEAMMQQASAHDILKELGPISEEEYQYYENL